ncbi:MAG: hypothetical protein HBSIN02_13750 [Bacteroidia bacterium]|nr:MAG: hypothetical protein HBSIN02_13750 [Bacteroidia bacterium]
MELPKSVITSWLWRSLPVLLGALGGYAYYYFIGCVSGTCPITGNPWTSTLYGAAMGFFLMPSLRKPTQGS